MARLCGVVRLDGKLRQACNVLGPFQTLADLLRRACWAGSVRASEGARLLMSASLRLDWMFVRKRSTHFDNDCMGWQHSV